MICDTVAIWQDALDAVTADPLVSLRAGAIYMENSKLGITSSNNLFDRCQTAVDGGIFYLVETSLTDSNSIYTKIQALYGSAMKCRNCQF